MGMDDAIKELYERREKARQMGGKEQVSMQHARGRLTARERIEKLFDPGSFWELGLLNRSDIPEMYERTAADGRICGVGTIQGRRVAVVAEDRTILGGSGGRVGTNKTHDMHQMAVKWGYPIIALGDELAAAEKNYLHDIIDPRDTRKFLAEALDMIRGDRGPIISQHRLQNWPTVF